MTTNAVVVTNTLPTSNGSYVDFTSSGFGTPDAAIVIVSNANTTNNPQAPLVYSIGFWVSAAQATAAIAGNDSQADTVTWRQTQSGDVSLILALPTGNTSSVLAEISATATTDGIRLTKDSGSSSAERYATVILINGCLNEYVGSVNLGTGTSAINVTAPGFRADLVFALTVGAVNDTGLGHAILSFGAAHINASDTVSQGLISFSSEDAVADTDVDTMVRDDAVACQNFNGTLSWSASIGANASGFSITPSANASSDIVYYLALELANPADAYVAIKDTITGTGNQAYTGAGFTPSAIILGQTMCTAVNTNTSQGYFSIGAGGPDTSEQCLGIIDEDAQTVSDNECYADTSNIVNIRSAVGSTDTIASLSSLDSDGWTLNYSDGSATARKMLAIAIGNSSSGAQTLTPSLVTNSQTFHAPTITTGAVTLAPSLVTNSQTFHAATVSTGSVTLEPSLVTNGQTFYAPVVSSGGATLAPSLVTNSQTFPSPTISVGAVTLTLDVVVNGQTFYAPTVAQPSGQTLEPTLVTNGQTFYGPIVEGMLLTQADLDAIAAAMWADPAAVAAHAKLDTIIARITC